MRRTRPSQSCSNDACSSDESNFLPEEDLTDFAVNEEEEESQNKPSLPSLRDYCSDLQRTPISTGSAWQDSSGGYPISTSSSNRPPLVRTELEVKRVIIKPYRTIWKRNIWNNFKILEQALEEEEGEEDCNPCERISSLGSELQTPLSFIIQNLPCQSQRYNLHNTKDGNGEGGCRDLENPLRSVTMTPSEEIESVVDHTLGGCCLALPAQLNTRTDLQKTAESAVSVREDRASSKVFDVENSHHGYNVQKGKMDAETNKSALLDQKDNLELKLNFMSNSAFLGSILAYGVIYIVGTANLARKGNYTRVVSFLHIWTAVMMLLLLIGSYIRWSAGALKTMRLVMAQLIFLSALVIFILVHWDP